MMREQQSRKPDDMRSRHRTAVPSGIAAPGNSGHNGDAGCAHSYLRSPTAEIGCIDARECDQLGQGSLRVARVLRILAELADRRHRHHAGYIARKLNGAAGVAGSGDAGDSVQSCLGDFLRHEFGEVLAAYPDLHDVQAPLDALIQRIDEIAEMTARHHLEYMHLGAGRAADDAGRGNGGGGNDAGAMGALCHLVRFPALRVPVSGEIYAPDDMTKERVRSVAAGIDDADLGARAVPIGGHSIELHHALTPTVGALAGKISRRPVQRTQSNDVDSSDFE